MNKRDAINQIRQFGGRLDRIRQSVGKGGDNRNAPKRPKPAIVTLSPLLSTSPMVPKMPSMTFSTSALVILVSLATLVIN